MTKLIVAFRNFANAPKYILMRLEIGTVVEHRIYDDTCVPYNHETELLCYYLCVQQKLLRIKYCTFSCDNDGLKVTPLNGTGNVTVSTICTLFL